MKINLKKLKLFKIIDFFEFFSKDLWNENYLKAICYVQKSLLHSDLLSTIFWNSTLASRPLDLAWIPVMMSDKRSSLISSNCPRSPALKNTFKIQTRWKNMHVFSFCHIWTYLCLTTNISHNYPVQLLHSYPYKDV